jgi:hypothetical protein
VEWANAGSAWGLGNIELTEYTFMYPWLFGFKGMGFDGVPRRYIMGTDQTITGQRYSQRLNFFISAVIGLPLRNYSSSFSSLVFI